MGKSALALRLAPRFNAQIVSADSRQVYRYLDIGTAKPSLKVQAQIRHYMIDLVEPDETYSAARFAEEGRRVLRRIASEGSTSFVVGGTGFYVRALLQGVSLPAVPPDPDLRADLHREAREHGVEGLYGRLEKLDPASATRVHPRNLPRIIRALEIVDHTGGPVPQPAALSEEPALYIGLNMDRERLKEVADQRVLQQVECGLVIETRTLLEMGYSAASPALDGFGYRQMISYLRGDLSLPQAISEYQTATRRYIRRQMTWFRADPRIHWVDAENDVDEAAATLIERWLECPTG